MPLIKPPTQDAPEKVNYIYGFQKGVNTLQDDSLIDDHELSGHINGELVVDGIQKRLGSLNYGSSLNSQVFGGAGFYTSAGSRFIIREGGTALVYYNASKAPTAISGATMTASKKTEFAMARDTLYVVNSVDPLVKLVVSGGVPVATVFTALTTPTGLSVTPTFKTLSSISSITRSGTTATVTTSAAHGLTTGDYVTISGADQTDYNITAKVTVTSTTTFTYTVANSPTTPATGTFTLKTGGVTSYSYRVSAYNATGETLACTSVSISNGHAGLSSDNFNALSWSAVTGAVGYVIYGRQGTAINGIGETKLNTSTTTTFNDAGADTPSQVITPQEGNTTVGPAGSMIIYALARLFIAGDPNNPSRLYYSTGGTQIDDFSSAFGGGFVDVAKNDGTKITGIYFFQNNIIVFKDHSIWQFAFTSAGIPQLTLITAEVGCCSSRSIKIVNNDLWFAAVRDGKVVVYSLGNVQNYFNSLRTTEQSLKVSSDSLLGASNLAAASNISAFYFRNRYGISIATGSSTTNNRIYIYDSRFSAWVGYWTGMNANSFFTFIDSSGSEDLYYCDETSGNVVKMFTGTDDNGAPISWKLQTKNFNQSLFDQSKIYRNPVFWFKNVSNGVVTGFIINDGIFNSGTFSIAATVSGISFGFDKFGTFKFGTSLGRAPTTSNNDQPMEIIFNKVARSMKFELDEASGSGSFKFLGLSYKWLLLQGKPLPAINRVRLS